MSEITAEQISLTGLLITWSVAIYDIPDYEYKIIVHIPGGSIEILTEESPYIYHGTVPGVYTFQEYNNPQHYPITETKVTLKGNYNYGPHTVKNVV